MGDILVLGAGSWGTSLALLLSNKGESVSLWEFDPKQADRLKRDRENKIFLPGFEIPESVVISNHLEELVSDRTSVVVLVVPSQVTREVAELARSRGIPLRRGQLSGLRAAAEADPFPEEPFEALLVDDRPRFLVALDRVTDVGNLGSIARSAECAGVTGLVLEHREAPPVEPGALRVSAGALEYLRVGRTPRLKSALELASRDH